MWRSKLPIHRKEITIYVLLLTLAASITVGSITISEDIDAPDIGFITPTPENGSTTANNWISVNVYATEPNIIPSDDYGNISTFIDFDNSLVGWWRMEEFLSGEAA